MGKIKLMVAGDSLNQETGLSYVASSFMKMFQATGEFELAHMTLCGDPSTYEGMSALGKDFQDMFRDMKRFNCLVTSKSVYADIDAAIGEWKPDIIFTVHDPWVVDGLAYSSYRESYTLINYVTVEIPKYPDRIMQPSPVAPGQRKSIKDILTRADLVIPVTKMGGKALSDMGVPVGDTAYNGLDWDLRCTEKPKKSEVFAKAADDDDFVFITMGLNTERKRIDRVVEAFWKFQQKMQFQSKYKLYIHTDLTSSTGGTDLREMMDSLKISDYVIVSTNLRAGRGVPKDKLYRLYAASDCYVGLPSGEGFGYGFAEAMMHALPLIYINYGGHTDYCRDAGLPVDVAYHLPSRNAYMLWALADTDHAAKQMARMVSDKRQAKSFGEKGYQFAEANLKWEDIFKKVLPMVEDAIRKTKAGSFSGIPLRRIV